MDVVGFNYGKSDVPFSSRFSKKGQRAFDRELTDDAEGSVFCTATPLRKTTSQPGAKNPEFREKSIRALR